MNEFKEKNFQDRLDFIKKYADWMKKNTDREWSKQQKEFINSIIH